MKSRFINSLLVMAIVSITLSTHALNATPEITENTLLASIGEKKFTVSDLQKMLQALPPQMRNMPAERLIPLVMRAWVQEQLFVAEARKTGIRKNDLYLARVKNARIQALFETYMQVKTSELVTDEKIKAAYDTYIKENFENKKLKERKIQHALFTSKDKADEALKLYTSKSLDMDEIVAKFSSDKLQNGVLGYINDLHKGIPAEFRKEVENMKESEIRGPFKTRAGWHLVKCLDVRDLKKPELSDMTKGLQQQVAAQEIEKHYEALKKAYNVKLEKVPGLTEPAKKP
ncbi:MAG: peptidyl-prolyl cis-trans isomerase [Alphaproteobacteria bacterium]|nr:MAG: peptidyl-prolyl cis-trans isomerase [Alphaproteobacteria bacterium]